MALPRRRAFEARLKDRVSQRDFDRIMLAYEQSKAGHRPKPRDDGERYFNHPKRVALILTDELGIYTPNLIIVALLHDIMEDGHNLTWWAIRRLWGVEVERMLRILTKSEKRSERGDYLPDILIAKRGVRLVKLADRLDNLRCLKGCTREKQEHYLEETREWYMPLAAKTHPYFLQKIDEELQKTKQRLA